MPLPASFPVDPLGVAHVQRLEHLLQTIVGCRDGNQVNVIGHNAISKDFNLTFIAVLPEPRQINFTILICKKNVFAPITTLGHVMWKAGKYCPM